jgi:hypothetical protein
LRNRSVRTIMHGMPGSQGAQVRDELLERELELAVLDGLVQRVDRGSAALALIEGPAGIGKSRLLPSGSGGCPGGRASARSRRAAAIWSAGSRSGSCGSCWSRRHAVRRATGRRAGTDRALRSRRAPPARWAHRPRFADSERAAHRRARRRGSGQPRDRAGAHVTPKTVEFHLTSVYRKLGISTRAGLTRALASPTVS